MTHIVPNSEGGWSVKEHGKIKPLETFRTQAEAIKAYPKAWVHRKDGSIRKR